jgi:hypothetical protein
MPFYWGYLYDRETIDYLSWDGYGSQININGPISYIYTALYLAALIGMLFYKNWARFTFFLLAIFSIVSAPFWGVSVQGGYDSLLGTITSLADGGIIAMAYLTAISSEFTKNV